MLLPLRPVLPRWDRFQTLSTFNLDTDLIQPFTKVFLQPRARLVTTDALTKFVNRMLWCGRLLVLPKPAHEIIPNPRPLLPDPLIQVGVRRPRESPTHKSEQTSEGTIPANEHLWTRENCAQSLRDLTIRVSIFLCVRHWQAPAALSTTRLAGICSFVHKPRLSIPLRVSVSQSPGEFTSRHTAANSAVAGFGMARLYSR
jgi:hypothetical protein